ncbi:aminoglycoside phosphotransferase family protein [Bacillus sp. SG-1]|uniref:aminoglycoside phosphotransferase family protein n=1 Tax=Bacillus sp. SG-1 TaxID=161544 RepID=UPI0001543F34|nr:aminoglycoside phosphotransferase family protein [Bacillus sp. SG-1]EDL66416.1 possible aminoglycoside phophotransferase [Bacillus sp. SG-1]
MNQAQFEKVIEVLFPDIIIQEVTAYEKGWDNDIFIVNKEIVFRFPRSEEVASKVKDEIILLKHLAHKEPKLDIPRYKGIEMDGNLKCVKYNFMKGKSLSEIKNSRLDLHSAELLGDFLSRLHSIELSALKETNITSFHTDTYWENLYESAKTYVFPNITHSERAEIQQFYEDFSNNPIYSNVNKAVIHGDLTAANILYNKEEECVSGIIDFTDAQIADPAFDFAGLYWAYGPEFTKKLLTYYDGKDKTGIFERVQSFYGLQPIFHELIYAVKENHDVDWGSALERFQYLNSHR